MNSNIGKIIAEKRKAIGLTQQELADKLFVTNKAVSKWENGHGLPDINIITSLSKILGISLNEIFGYSNPEDVKQIIAHKNRFVLYFYLSVLFYSLGLVASFIFKSDFNIAIIIFAVFSVALICFCVLNYTYNIARYKKNNRGNVLLNYFSNILKQSSSILIAVFLTSVGYLLFLTLLKDDVNNQALTVSFILLLSLIQVLSLAFVFGNKKEESRIDDTATEVLVDNKEINSDSDCILHGFSSNISETMVYFGASLFSRIGIIIKTIAVFIKKKNYVLTLNENQIKLIGLKRFTRKVKEVPPTVFDWSVIQNIEVFKTKFGNNHYAIKLFFAKGGALQFEFRMAKQKESFLRFRDLYEKKFNKQLTKARIKVFH